MYRRIRDLREDTDHTQEDIAAKLGCARSTYCECELGISDPSTKVLASLSEIYNVSVEYILGLTDNPQKPQCLRASSVSERIFSLRKTYNYTQAYIASILNCSQNTYSYYESGHCDISTDTLIALSRLYKVSTDYIIGISDN